MPQIRLFCSALAALLVSALAVRRQPFAALAASLGTINAAETPSALPIAQQRAADRICAMISRAATLTGPLTRCLARCCAAASLLRRAGIPYTLYCGAGPGNPDRFGAHAWLRAGSAVIGVNPDNRFTVMLVISHPGV